MPHSLLLYSTVPYQFFEYAYRTVQYGTRHKCYLFLHVLRVRTCSVAVLSVSLSGFRGLPQDVAVPSRFRRRESVGKIQM